MKLKPGVKFLIIGVVVVAVVAGAKFYMAAHPKAVAAVEDTEEAPAMPTLQPEVPAAKQAPVERAPIAQPHHQQDEAPAPAPAAPATNDNKFNAFKGMGKM